MPLPAPVTKATLPVKLSSGFVELIRGAEPGKLVTYFWLATVPAALYSSSLTCWSPGTGGRRGSGVDDPWADGIDADVRRRVVECGVFGQANHAVFCGGIGGAVSKNLDPGAGGGVDDRAAPMLEHQWNLVLHAQEHGGG